MKWHKIVLINEQIVSGILKKAAEKYLLEHDIDWRKEDTEKAESKK